MKEIYKKGLKKIYDMAMKDDYHFAYAVDFSEFKGKRNEIGDWLYYNGYITKLEYFGRNDLRCELTHKGVDYFAEENNE